jgi:CubicO group peptidase (beta-lactamase class C family)
MRNLVALTLPASLLLLVSHAAQADLASKLDNYLQQYVRSGKFGGTVLIQRGGQTILEKGYGPANRATGRQHTTQTQHLLASMTKQFTAALAMKQIEAGTISLQDRVRRFVPKAPSRWDEITVQELINHSSGFYDYLNSSAIMAQIRTKNLTPLQVIDTFDGYQLTATPGTVYSYTNSGYMVLGQILEVVSGLKFTQLLKRDILDPLEMTHTGTYPATGTPTADWSIGYKRSGSGWAVAAGMHPSIVNAVGDMYSTVEDLAKWDRSFLTEW